MPRAIGLASAVESQPLERWAKKGRKTAEQHPAAIVTVTAKSKFEGLGGL
jgi:hypothetical protein